MNNRARPSRSVRAGIQALALCLVALTPSGTLRAQGTGLVQSAKRDYEILDRLEALGLSDSLEIVGQRPYSSAEIRRIVRALRMRLEARTLQGDRQVSSMADELLQRLERTYDVNGPGTQGEPWRILDGAMLSYSDNGATRRAFTKPDFDKPAEATINPVQERRLGSFLPYGQSGALEVSQRVEPTDWLALQARERLEGSSSGNAGTARTTTEVLLGFARARYRNVALVVGRQQVTWSQQPGSGLFLASDAPALDMISLAADHPFSIAPLRWLGPLQGTLLLAELGPSVSRSHSKLLAYKVSARPTPAVEVGGTFLNHFGGEGGRLSSLGNHLIDFLPIIDVFRTHNYVDTTRTLDVDSDKQLGIDIRLRPAALRGIEITGEMLIDDFDTHRLLGMLMADGAQTLGVLFPRLGSPAVSLEVTVKHTGIITYTHASMFNGMTSRGHLFGDEIGPDAKSFGSVLRVMPRSDLSLAVEGRAILYSDALYIGRYSDAAQTRWVITKLSRNANELRDVLFVHATKEFGPRYALTVRTGLERIRNEYAVGGRRHDSVTTVALSSGF